MLKIDLSTAISNNCKAKNNLPLTLPKLIGLKALNWQPQKDTFAKSSISFTSNFIDYKDDAIEQDFEKEADEFCQKYFAYKTQTICDGTTKLFDNKNAFLYNKLASLIYLDNNENLARLILNKLDLIGPVGLEPNTYCNKKVPIFVQKSTSAYKKADSIEFLKNFRNSSEESQKSMKYINTEEQKKTQAQKLLAQTKELKIKEDKCQKLKTQLRPFIKKLSDFENGQTPLMPNCIMIVNDGVDVVYDVANWLKDITKSAEFEYIAGRYNSLDAMQDKLAETLEKAQNHYEKTKKRSIIFIPNMDDLINKEKNTQTNIAEMKFIMQAADEMFHSTIVFYTNPQTLSLLDKGTMQPNRVGLTVKI